MVEPFISIEEKQTKNPYIGMQYMHTHEFYEIYYFLKGNADFYIEGNRYPLHHGDIIITKKGEAHSLQIKSGEAYERIVLGFNYEALLKDYAPQVIAFLDNKPLGKNNRYSASIFKDKSWSEYLKKISTTKDFGQKQLYLTVFMSELSDSHGKISENEPATKSITAILEYINSHLKEKLTLDTICNEFYLSKIHLNRIIKANTGSTAWNYILIKRLTLANELLQKGEHPTEVYTKCGFSDYSTFYRAYKKMYKISPKQYNGQIKKQNGALGL